MQHLADLLATIPLPPLEEDEGTSLTRLPSGPWSLGCESELIHDLGADLPAGHLHVWGGPSGAGKTSFLLALLHGSASRGRRVAYATYDLAPESLALRMLAMAAQIDLSALPDPGGAPETCLLSPAEVRRAHAARAALSRLPFFFLAARGFSVESIHDRLVRMPFRAEVLALDYHQGVIRGPDKDMGVALRGLSDLAAHLHVAVICAVRSLAQGLQSEDALSGTEVSATEFSDSCLADSGLASCRVPDRVGWIAPALSEAASEGGALPDEPAAPTQGPASTSKATGAEGQTGLRTAQVMHNRHGKRTAVPLEFDEATGTLERAPRE